MCRHIIIDANMKDSFGSCYFRPLRAWIEKRNGYIVYTNRGKYAKEIEGKAFGLFESYRKNGLAKLIKFERVQEAQMRIDLRMLKSDDPHIIALAEVSGATILCAKDTNLQYDFGNPEVLPNVGHIHRAVYPWSATKKKTRRDFLEHRKCTIR